MDISIPYEVNEVLTRLIFNNHDAYIVGGSIRNILLGLVPHDWDVVTSALPHILKTTGTVRFVLTIKISYL